MKIYDTIFDEIDTCDNVQMYLYGAGAAFKYLRLYYRRSPLNGMYKGVAQLISEMNKVTEDMKAKVVKEPGLDHNDFLQGITDVWDFVRDYIDDNNSYPKPSEIEPMLEDSVKKIRFRDFVLVAGSDFYAGLRSGKQPMVQWLEAFRDIIWTMVATETRGYGYYMPFYGHIELWSPDVFEVLLSTAVPCEEYEIDIKMIRSVFEDYYFLRFDFDYWCNAERDWDDEEEVDETKEIFTKENYVSYWDLNSRLINFSNENFGGIFSTDEEACRNSLYVAFCIYHYRYVREIANPSEFQMCKPKTNDEQQRIRCLENKIRSYADRLSNSVREKMEEALSGNAEVTYQFAGILSSEIDLFEELSVLDIKELSVYYGKHEAIKEIVDKSMYWSDEREHRRWGVKKLADLTGRKISDILFDYAEKNKNESLDKNERYPSDKARKAKSLYDYSVKEGRRLEYNEYRAFHNDELRGTELIEEFTKTAEYMITDHERKEDDDDHGYHASWYLNPYVCYVFGNLLHRYKNETLAFSYYMTGAEIWTDGRGLVNPDYPRYVLYPICYALGQMYENGEGTDTDLDKAMKYYGMAAEHGMAEAQLAKARLVQKICPSNEGMQKAAELYYALDDTDKFSSSESSFSAQEIWGLRYENGYGVERSIEKAIEYYEKALESGESSIALRHLGDIYKTEYNNIGKAFEYYLRGTETGDPDMLCLVAEMYLNGSAGVRDESLAMKYALKAVKRGSLSAMKIMGDIARNNSDEESAALWYAGARIRE